MEKRNVMKSGVLWNEVVTATHKAKYPDVELSHMLADAGGTYRFSHAVSHLSFDVANVATANGVPLVQWHDTTGLNQRFAVKATGSGYQIVAQHSGRCIDLRDWSKSAGGALQQWDCGDQANQRWAFEPAGGATPPRRASSRSKATPTRVAAVSTTWRWARSVPRRWPSRWRCWARRIRRWRR